MKYSSVTLPVVAVFIGGMALPVVAGPYSAASDDAVNAYDAPVPGFVGPHGAGKARWESGNLDENWEPVFENPRNYLNPLFFGWASEVVEYEPSEKSEDFGESSVALGPATGNHFDAVSLGDLSADAIEKGVEPGWITLKLERPVRNLEGADFVVFENAYIADSNQGGAGAGNVFAELAYVEVSADGENFVRFPATSLTEGLVGPYGTIDATDVHGLAGKHVNAYGNSWGTPFDLDAVGLDEIQYIRVVDIPGNGAFEDKDGNPIYDAWKTFGSGGFDLNAVGVISATMTYDEWPLLGELALSERAPEADPDGDGVSNLLEYAFGMVPWEVDDVPSGVVVENGEVVFQFVRDERLIDLVYEVQVSETMREDDWVTIARGAGGNEVEVLEGYGAVVSEASASEIQSVGVLRRVSVRNASEAKACFFRVKVGFVSDQG